MSDGDPTSEPGSRRPPRSEADRRDHIEWAAALALAAISVVWWVAASRNLWFFADAWDFLAERQIDSLDSWLDPHIGHLQIPAFLAHRVLYALFGLDYSPWYVLPYAAGYAALAVFAWRSLLWRGASRPVAFSAFVLFLALETASVVYLTVIGVLVILAGFVVLLLWFDGIAVPRRFPRLWMTALLLVMVTTGSLGTITTIAAALVAATVPRLRRWLPSFVLPGALYAAWWVAFAGDTAKNDFDPGALVSLPGNALEMFGYAAARLFGLPDETRWVMGPLVIVLLGVALVLRRWTVGSWLAAITIGGTLLAVLGIRVAGDVPLRLPRYSFILQALLIVGFAPLVRLPARLPRAAGAVAVAALAAAVIVNGVGRTEAITARAADVSAAREGFDAVATLADRREPIVDEVRVEDLGYPGMSVEAGAVARFVADGYGPLPVDEVVLDTVRPRLRFLILARGRPEGVPVRADGATTRCVTVREGSPLTGTALRAGTLRLRPDGPRATLLLSWSDRFGPAERTVEIDEPQRLSLPDPAERGTAVAISVVGPRVEVCGVGLDG